jgi:hypothetical protein
VEPFAERGRLDIVHEEDRHPERSAQAVAQRKVPPAQIRGVADDPGAAVHLPGDPDADGRDRAGRPELLDHPLHLVDDAVAAAGRIGGLSPLRDDPAGPVHQPRRDLGAAQVDPDDRRGR